MKSFRFATIFFTSLLSIGFISLNSMYDEPSSSTTTSINSHSSVTFRTSDNEDIYIELKYLNQSETLQSLVAEAYAQEKSNEAIPVPFTYTAFLVLMDALKNQNKNLYGFISKLDLGDELLVEVANAAAWSDYTNFIKAVVRIIRERCTNEGKLKSDVLEDFKILGLREELAELVEKDDERAQANEEETYYEDSITDDITESERWIQVPFKQPSWVFDSDHGIRKEYHYKPENITSEIHILFFIIHGTWGKESKSYFDDNDVNYKGIKKVAAWYANATQKELKLFSYFWTGKWQDFAKKNAAENLRKFIKHIDPDRIADIVLLGHSHGCSVASSLSRNSRFKKKPIKLLLYFAGPVRRVQKDYNPKNYEKLFYFYSDQDYVIQLARLNEELAREEISSLGFEALMIPFAFSSVFQNVQKSINNTGQFLAKTKGDNHFKKIKNGTVAGFSVKFNGKDEGKIKGHTDIIKLAWYLPLILQKLFKQYPLYYKISSRFNLNTDLESGLNDSDAIYITIADIENIHSLENLRSLGIDPAQFKKEEEVPINNIQDFLEEIKTAEIENRRFFAKYGNNLSRSNRLIKILQKQILCKDIFDVRIPGHENLCSIKAAINKEIAEILLAQGINVNAENKLGDTALIWATLLNCEKIVKIFLGNGADVNHQNKHGDTALMSGANTREIIIATMLLECGADVNLKNNNKETALMHASYRGRLEIAELLLDRHADVNFRNKNGETALDIAKKNNHKKLVQRLTREQNKIQNTCLLS